GNPIVNYPSDIGVIVNMIRGPNAIPKTREQFDMTFGIGGLEKNFDLLRRGLECAMLHHSRDPGDPSYPRRMNAPGHFYVMSPAQREAHDQQHPPDGDDHRVLETDQYFTRMRQIANAVYLDPGGRPLRGDEEERAVEDALENKMYAGAGRADVVRRFNAPAGDPERYRAIILTDAGSKGLNLLDTRQVHVMEPQFNRSRVEQVIARAIRKDSHARLPSEERTVTVHEHFCVMPGSVEDDARLVPRVPGWLTANSGDSIVRQIAETKRARNDLFVRELERIVGQNEATC
ncbi:hypothetical protein KFL_009350010, partial [Klebsormidium nitens]